MFARLLPDAGRAPGTMDLDWDVPQCVIMDLDLHRYDLDLDLDGPYANPWIWI